LVMLYPLTDKQLDYKDPETDIDKSNEKLWFIKQRIGNACGTIGILHSIMNLVIHKDPSLVLPGSWLEQFVNDVPVPLGPIQKAERLETDTKIAKLHDVATSSSSNQTNRGDIDQKIITHFIALFPSDDGTLYELDGRKDGPIRHGSTSSETFLYDACQVVQQFMSRDPTEIRFTMLALAPTIPDE
jgi:ubiquitin carboxyl-terminal hydrolase L3